MAEKGMSRRKHALAPYHMKKETPQTGHMSVESQTAWSQKKLLGRDSKSSGAVGGRESKHVGPSFLYLKWNSFDSGRPLQCHNAKYL